MKPFIYSILLFFIGTISFSQTKEVILKKHFKVDKNTVLNLDLDNVAIVFEESLDDKIHFDYGITFIRYPKRKREDLLDDINVKTSQKGNTITLDVKNSMYVGINSNYLYSMDSLKSAIMYYGKTYRKRAYDYKTKEILLNEIVRSVGNDLEDFLFKNKSKYENQAFINTKKKDLKSFIIRVPKYTCIKIKALHSNLTFKYDIEKSIVVNAFQGDLKFKKLVSKDIKFVLMNGFFQAEEIKAGAYSLKDVHPTKIGSISNAKLETETSSIEIGEIGENVQFNDFNSKLYFYDFGKNFTKFDLKGDYSKLTLYKVKNSHYNLNVYGFNTTLNMNEVKTTFGISKEKEMTKILEKKVKLNEVSSGKVEIELTNAILTIK
ncbi:MULTISPECIES: hypothetical protein [unclassified Polaribacter]|uniref:hypothetical protein n=1 Tax=unclassified Polaribacter TaxID=196858 RepID=UPI0011BF29A6|nr:MULTISPECIES: hypothetical protein [unclassified Polaribacter]TXD53483.1 hypothetical protein ES043_03595 [Polaribacter sp. IC063]TXD57722.1 hypothetical protein ES044_14320 [Polaribacter sp. IC066]